MNLSDPQIFGIVSIAGVIYGYIFYSTPVLPRRSLRTYIQVCGTSTITYGIIRNFQQTIPVSRIVPIIIWLFMVLLGAYIHSIIDMRYSFRDLFAEELEPIPTIGPTAATISIRATDI